MISSLLLLLQKIKSKNKTKTKSLTMSFRCHFCPLLPEVPSKSFSFFLWTSSRVGGGYHNVVVLMLILYNHIYFYNIYIYIDLYFHIFIQLFSFKIKCLFYF